MPLDLRQRWCWTLVALAVGAAAPARAQDDADVPRLAPGEVDTAPPRITAFVPKSTPAGPFVVRLRIVDASPILVATFYWRAAGATTWDPVPLEGLKSLYSATIAVGGDFEWYVEAFDEVGNPPALFGRPDAPNRTEVTGGQAGVKPGTPPVKSVPPKRPEPVKPPDDALEIVAPVTPPPAGTPGQKAGNASEEVGQLVFEQKPAQSFSSADPEEKLPPPNPVQVPTDGRLVFDRPEQKPKNAPKTLPPLMPVEPPKPAEPPKPEEPPAPPLPLDRVWRVSTATVPVVGRGEVAVSGGLLLGSDFLVPGGSLVGANGSVRGSYALHRYLEAGATVSGQASWLSAGQATWKGRSVGDLELHARTVSPDLGPLHLALEATLGLPTIVDSGRLAASFGLRAAATYERGRLRAHAMAGYRFDNSERLYPGRWSPFAAFSMGLSRFDELTLGAAAEAGFGAFHPFLEYVAEVPVERRHFASCDGAPESCRTAPDLLPVPTWAIPQRAGAGFRLEIAEKLAIVAAAELSLTPAGRELSDTQKLGLAAPEGLPLPPPFAASVAVHWQFGTPLPPAEPAKKPENPVESAPAKSPPLPEATAPAAPVTTPPAAEKQPATPSKPPDPAAAAPAPTDAPAPAAPEITP